MLDGEIMSSSFQDLLTQFRRKHDVPISDAVYHVFDWLPLHDFQKGICYTSQLDRTVGVPRFIPEARTYVRQVGWTILHLERDARDIQKLEEKVISEGYEGLMFKDPLAAYQCKRTFSWLKVKPYIELTLGIRDVIEGEGKAEGMMGALVCSGQYEGDFIAVSVGSGFSDDLRVECWHGKDELIGRLIEVRADAVTTNQDGTKSLRFPRFKSFRGFELGEQL